MTECILHISCHAYRDYRVTCTGFPAEINQWNVTLTCSELKRKKQGNQYTHTQRIMWNTGWKWNHLTYTTHPWTEKNGCPEKSSLLVTLFQHIYLTCFLLPFCARGFTVTENWENYKYTTAINNLKSLLFQRSSSLLKGGNGGPIIPQVQWQRHAENEEQIIFPPPILL